MLSFVNLCTRDKRATVRMRSQDAVSMLLREALRENGSVSLVSGYLYLG